MLTFFFFFWVPLLLSSLLTSRGSTLAPLLRSACLQHWEGPGPWTREQLKATRRPPSCTSCLHTSSHTPRCSTTICSKTGRYASPPTLGLSVSGSGGTAMPAQLIHLRKIMNTVYNVQFTQCCQIVALYLALSLNGKMFVFWTVCVAQPLPFSSVDWDSNSLHRIPKSCVHPFAYICFVIERMSCFCWMFGSQLVNKTLICSVCSVSPCRAVLASAASPTACSRSHRLTSPPMAALRTGETESGDHQALLMEPLAAATGGIKCQQ